MKKTILGFLVCLTFTLVLLSSCASTSEKAAIALEKGDYTVAISQSLKSLEDGKDVLETELYLQDAWERANIEWNAQIATIEQSTTAEELHKAIPVYNKLLDIHEMIQNAGRNDLKPNRSAILEKALATEKRVADLYYTEASATLALGGRENARKAIAQYAKIKNLIPEYPNLDKAIVEADKQATVKVIVTFDFKGSSNFDDAVVIPLIEKQLSALPFVEVLPVTEKPNADILVHITGKASYTAQINQISKSIDKRVTSASGWYVETISPQTLATYEITYNVTDLKTGTVIDEGVFSAKDSTDHGFSVSAILETGDRENIQVGDMTSRRSMLVNSIASGKSGRQLPQELMIHEVLDRKSIPPIEPVSTVPIDFNKYKTFEQLAQIKNLNGHTFFQFHFFKATELVDGKNVEKYYSTYTGPESGVKYAAADMTLYKDLKAWIRDTRIHAEADRKFVQELVNKTMPKTLAEKVAPVLK